MQFCSGFVKRSNAFSASFSFMRSASAARYFSNLENETTSQLIQQQKCIKQCKISITPSTTN
jgi:hypothetical protein